MSDIQQALYDFDATIKAKPELTDSDLLELFPELEGDTARLRAAYDYSATLNSGKYKGPEEFNAKFPELFGEPEKPRYQMPTAEKQYVAPVLGGKQPEQAPQEKILPDYRAIDAARTMTPAETNQVLNQGVPGVTRIGDTNISHLQTDMLMNEKFGGGYKDTSAGRTEEVTPVGEMETGVELVGAPFNPDEEEPYQKERPDGFFSYIGDNINAVNTGASQAVAGLMGYGEEFYRNLEKVGIPGVSDLFGTYADAWGGVKEYFKRDAAASMARTSNYEGKDFTDLWKEGRYADSIAKLYTDATQSIPLSVASMGAVAAGRPDVSFSLMYASQAGNTMDELRDNTDMTDTQKQVNAHLIGAAEALSELFGDKVMVGWLGDVFKKGGERLLKSKIASGVRPMIHNLLKSNSLLIPPAIEGTEEFVNSLAQNVINYTTGKTNVYKPLEGTLEAFIQGFAGGSQFAAVGAGKMAYDQGVEYVKGFEAKTNFNHSRKEYERLMSENGYAPADIQEIETQLIAATPEEAQKMIGQLVQNMNGGVIELEDGNYELHEAFTQPLVDLYTSGKQLEHRSKKLQTKVQEFNQRAEQYVTDNLNPDMNALVFAEFQGQPVRVVSGVVQMKDKEIDTEVSTPEIYIETQEGIRIIPPQLLDARKGLRITPAQQAVQEIAQQAAEPVVAQHENEEVRPYNEGEIVRAEIAGSPVLGTIVGKTEQGYTIRDAQGMMIQIQPRQIINEDNLEGVDNESVVEYRDQSGAIRTGVVNDIHSERVQGYAYIDDQRIPFSDILGLKTDEVVEEQPQNVGSAPVANSNMSETQETQAGATQDAEQTVQAQYPVTTKGELDFDNFTPEQLFSYTAEQYGEEAAIEDVKVSIAGLETQLSKKKKAFEKMGMKDRVKARAEISKIEAEIASFSSLIPTAPVETAPPAVESAPATQLSTPPAQQSAPAPEVSAPVENTPSAKKRRAVKDGAKKNTTGRPQWLVNKVRRSGEPKNLRELIMHKLIFGAKLRWNDIVSENKAILTRGLGGEYRYAEAERKPRANSMMGYVSESGITPEQLAHQIWEANALEDGQFEDIPLTGYDTQQILDEILDVANTYPTVSGMARDLEKWAEKIEQDEKSYFDEIMEMEQEDGLPMAEEFEIFVDNIPQEAIDNSLRAANFTPEELNELFEFLNNVYENDEQGGSRGTKEDAEASGNNESGVKSQEGRNATSEGTTNQRGDSGSSPADQRAEQGAGLTDEINSQSPELNPTEAQKEAGNYKKAHIKFQGMDITIENPKNSVRSGVDENGKAWSNTLQNHYGYFTRTTGKDGDHIDTFIGENTESNMVFVVDQNNPETGRFDESKVMLGFNNIEEAQAAYMGNYEAGWKGFGSITPVSIEDFKKWLYDGARQRKPFAEYKDTPAPLLTVDSPEVLAIVQKLFAKKELSAKEAAIYNNKENDAIFNTAIGREVMKRNREDDTDKDLEKSSKQQIPDSPKVKIQTVIDSYNESVNMTIPDVINSIADIAYENDIKLIQNAYDRYKQEIIEDTREFGERGDREAIENTFMDVVMEYIGTLGSIEVKPIEADQAENEDDLKSIEGKKKPEPTTVRELADYDAGEQKGYLSGMFFSGLEKGSKFKVARKDYEVTQYSKPKKVEFVGKKGNQITYDEITIRIKELATGKTITTKLITWPNGNSQFTGVESNQNHEQLSRDIEGDVNTDLINEYNRFHEKSDSFKIIQKQLDKLKSQQGDVKPEVKPKRPIESVEPQSPIDNLNAILSGEKVVEAPTLEDQLKAAEQKLSTVKKDRDKKYRRYLDLKERLDEIGSRDQVDVEGNVGNGMLAFEELDKEAKEKVNAARKEYEPLNEQVKELESKIEKLQGRIKDQKMNQQEMNFDEPVEPEIKEQPNKVSKAQAEADAALQDFMDAFNDLNNLGIVDNTAEKQAKLLITGTKMVGAFTKLGVYKFAELIKAIQAKGIQITDDLLSAIKKSYGAFAAENDIEELDDMKTVRAFKIEEKPAMEVIQELFEGSKAEVVKTISEENAVHLTENKQRFINAVVEKLGNEKLTIVSLRKIADESGLGNIKDTAIQEYTELAIVMKARAIAKQDISQEEKFRQIVELYQAQPTISMRSSERIDKQQYSTPIPLSFLAGEFINKINPKSVLEPSAGNGMMVFNVDEQVVIANEIDEVRLENLRDQGFKVTNQDGTLEFNIEPVDAVVTNPPFGKSEAREYEGYKIAGLDEQMTINALLSMKDNGRAAIIIGGHTKYKDNGTLASEKAFINYLYDKYNVVDIINVDGALYRKQGTSFPVRMILINGRRTGFESLARKYAPLQKDARSEQVSTFEELFNRIQENENNLLRKGESIRVDNGTQPATESDRGDVQGISARPNRQGSTSQGKPGTSSVRPSQNGGLSNTTGLSSVDDAGRPNMEDNALDRGDDDGANNRPGSNRGVQRKDVSEFLNGSNARPEPLKIDLSKEKTPYPSRSKSDEIGSVVPTNVAQTINEILHKFKDIDSYVQYKLGYQSKEELFGALSAEQIDSVALAIYQIENNRALIIGDMTGVGKGRQAAAIIRYAAFHGHKPVFITEKAHLFSDIYRDLRDIGSADLRPFIFNAKSADADPSMTDENGVVVYKVLSPKVRNAVLAGQSLPDEYDYAVLSYSQLSGDTEKNGLSTKQSFLTNIARNNVLILDESHNAGGDGNTGTFLTELLQETKGVVFLSGTFAKRADNMPIYAIKTSMSDANMSDTELIEAIKKGGVPLQEIMSKNLTETGQMVRRERDFSGVTIDWQTMTEAKEQHFKTFDGVIEVFNELIEFQKEYVDPVIETINADLADEQGGAEVRQGTANLGISNVPFASKTFNLVRQLLFSLKAKEVAAEAIKELQKGNKPVIAVGNTMEAFLNEMGQVGDVVQKHDYSLTLLRGLTGLFRITRVDANNERHHEEIGLDAIGEAGRRRYAELEDKINKLSSGISISPIDVIKKEITDAGYSIGELTGRSNELVFNEDGTAVISKRTNTDKKKLARDFNSGELDALVLNQSASTGISLHASSKFRDQRQRVMLFAQNQLDVNTEVQMRGRIDRTGQKQRGAYRYIISAIPAEQRIIMMFKAKLKSLDANTTSSQKSKVNEIEVVDFLNKYGDEIAIEYLKENPEINIKMLDPYGISEMDDTELARFTKADGAASKVAGRAALLSVKEQEAFYSEMTEKYTTLINYLNDSGTNDLEITTLPLNAETTAKHIVIQGSNNGNPFSEDSIRETTEVDVLKKPMSMAEINEEAQKLTGGLSPTEYRDMMVEKIRTHLTEQTNKETDKIRNDYAKREQAHFDKINKEIDRDIKRGEVQESDRNEILSSKRELWDGSMRLAIENKTNAIRTRYESVIQIIRSLPTGRVVLIPSTLEIDATTTYSEGMFLGFRMKDKITTSTITAVFAPLDSRRRIDVPLSKVPFLQAVYAQTMQGQRSIRANKENWDSLVPTRTRRTAYIISGNILQAYGRPELRGQLVTYTTKEGAVRQGILLPERYRHDEQTMRVQIIKKIDALRAGEDLSDQSNGVTVKKESPTSYSITVPLSRIRGGKYFLDEELRSMVYERDFRQMAGQMVGVVSEANIERALQYLSDKFNISVNDKMKEAKEDAAFKIVGENLPATININGVERPTTNSEGKPIHSTEEGIRNFYEWFSNSKVVDEQGRPFVVYHGAYENFDVFKKSELGKYTNAESAKQGFFFTDKKDLASDFAYDSARSFGKYSEKQILAQIQKADFEKINEFVTRKIKGEYDFSIYNSINEYLEDNRKIKSIEPSESEYRDAINNLAAEYLYNGISDSDTSNEYKRIFDELGISIGYVQEVELKIENPLVVNKAIDFEDGDGLTHYIEKAKKDGNDGVIFNNVREVILEGSKMTKQFVVFEPTQIKSATGNSGEFSGNTDDMLFKMSPYYSPTERALETLKQEKGTPDQMKAMLLKNGAKEAEFEWMGWDEFVSDKKTISKVDIQQWIDENKIEIQEVEKGSVKPMATMANISEVKFSQYGSGSYLVSYRMGEDEGVVIIGTYEAGNEQEAKEKALERINNSESDYVSQATKFSQYVLPGGENYKELLLTMPATHYMYDINKVKIEETNTFWMFYDKDGELITGYAKDHNPTKEDAINTFKSNFKIDNKDVFQSSHFDEPNILAHVRFNERTVNGERVLFIEEIQSDWAQSGKKSGFKNTEDNDNVKSARKSYEEAKAREDEVNNKLINVISEAQKMGLPVGASNSEWNKFTYGLFKTSEVYRIENKMQEVKNNKDWNEYQSMLDEITSKQNELGKQRLELIRERDYIESLSNDRKEKLDREIRNQEFNSVPDMPFKKTDQWVNLTLRRMMQYAAENGFDRVAWTNGTQQAERYDLSKQIESVEYFDTSGRLIAYNKEGNSVINEAGIEQNKVEDYIGKEATKKLFENITEERNGVRKYELKGEQLSVGGEGMKAFYDKIVPTQAGKLVKPFGVKVESIDIKTLDTSNTKVETTEKGNYRLVDDKGNTLSSMTKETGDGFSKADLHSELVYLAKRYPTMNATAMVQSIPVNQEMREVLAAGIPLFKMSAQTGKGMSLEDAQWLSDTLTGVFNVEGTEGKTPTVVVASTKDLIEKLPGYAKQLTAYQVSGINTGDKVYINMEHVKSKEQFVKTWLHEHIHQITIDNYTENGIERFYNSLPAEVKGVLRSGYSGKSNLIKGLEIIAHYTEVLLDSVGLENLMNGNFDLSLVPESVRPILGEHLEIITYGNYQNNRENQLNDSRNDRGTTKGLQTTTARAGYQRDGSIRNTRRGNEDRAAFRITDDVSPLRDVVDAKLRKAVVKIGNRQLGEGFRFKVQENWQDSHIAVKHFLDVLRTNGVVIEDFNDYYLQVTQVPGRTDAQVDNYERMFHKPLMEAIGELQKQGMSYRDVENYAIMKHGIERNEYMRNQEAKIYAEKKVKKPTLKEQELDIDGSVMDEYRAALQDAYESKLISLSDKDYSGITAVAEEVEMTAEEYVAFIEGRITEQAINNFWTAVNNATNNSLEQAFKAGSISKATYEDLKSRYQFYIPLRGFDQEIAEDRYDYAPDMGTYYSLPMISAKGRKSRSETPFAYIWQMNQSAITFANRNLLNQSIKRLSAKNTQGLLTAKKAWYMLTGEIDGVKQWELREPEYSPDWKQYQKNIETFEEEMQELEEKGFASQRGGKLNLGLFTKPKQASQHTVHVMQNGVEYVIYFNADPAVSRAINGSNRTIANPGRVETFVRNASRTMAANFTTRNPVFVLSNFSRDFLYAASTLPAKESAAYAAKFVKNIPLVAASLKRAIKGKPDMTNPIDQLAVEYILNGGKTGYSSIVELQKTQKRIERDLRRHGKSSKAEALLKGIQAANEFAENITRLSAYVTSRHEGRSIIQSISDAKELTVNFNRNGAGGYGAAFIKSYWLFVNAGIQAMANFYSIAKNHPGKTAAVIATYMAWGVIQPLLISLLGDDDDLEEYFKMSDWERQNNLIFPTGAGFIKIPLPHELRLFHAMGDNIAQTIFGYKDAGETIADTAMSFADLIPISPAGAIDASWVEMLPDAIKPLAQIHFTNTNFMGGRIVDEYKTRSEVMPGYRMARTNKKGEVLSPSFVVGVTKFLDHMTGGDGTQKGLVSMNPDEVNHLLRGYFGGLYTMAVQFGGIAYSGYEWSKGGDLKVKFKDTPLKAFYTSTDELNEKNSGLNKNFYRIKNEAENVLEAGKDYIKRSSNGEFDAIELDKKLEEINYHFYYEMNERFIKPVKTVEGKLDELPEEYIKEAETIINMHKENLINFYHDGTKSGE